MQMALVEQGFHRTKLFWIMQVSEHWILVRAKDIFGQTELIIISQKFHNERAVFLARKTE
jgi:SanA protein